MPYEVDYQGWNFGGAGNPYNVAIGGATSATLLAQGQDTEVAALVAAGDVDLATLSIGRERLQCPGDPNRQRCSFRGRSDRVLQNVVNNIDTAMDTVLAAHPLGMIVAGIPDLELVPGGRAIFNTPTTIRAVRSPSTK